MAPERRRLTGLSDLRHSVGATASIAGVALTSLPLRPAVALRDDAAAIAAWRARRWIMAAAAGTLAGLAMGIPSGVVPTDLYTRMTPVAWWDYPVLATSAVLAGLIAATYVRDPARDHSASRLVGSTAGATALTTLAVGCPICNKLVVGLVGVSGALSYWAPLQPLIGLLSICVLAIGLRIRLRATSSCPTPESG